VILAAIAEAQLRGARLAQACRVVGILARTVERWRARPAGDDGRCGPHRRPHNALSPLEEAQVLSVLTSARYALVSPKQCHGSPMRAFTSHLNQRCIACSDAMAFAPNDGV
jgi:putative transposase